MNKKIFALLITLIFVSSTSVVNAALLSGLFEGKPKRVELIESSDKLAAFKDAFTPKGAFAKTPALVSSNTKKVVIAGFQIEFATEQKAIEQGGGTDAGLASTTDKIYTLTGTKDEQMQAVTEKMYAAYAKHLQDRGYEVLPASALLATSYKDTLSKANQPPVHHERGAVSDFILGTDEKKIENASVIATAKGTSPEVFSGMMGNWRTGANIADTLKANVIYLRMKVNFARFEESGWFSPGVDDKPQNLLGTKGTALQIFSPAGKSANFALANTVILPNRLADIATPIAATAGQTSNRAAGGLFRVLQGLAKGGVGGVTDVAAGATASAHSVMASGNFEIAASPNYEEIVSKDLNLALEMLAEAFPK